MAKCMILRRQVRQSKLCTLLSRSDFRHTLDYLPCPVKLHLGYRQDWMGWERRRLRATLYLQAEAVRFWHYMYVKQPVKNWMLSQAEANALALHCSNCLRTRNTKQGSIQNVDPVSSHCIVLHVVLCGCQSSCFV